MRSREWPPPGRTLAGRGGRTGWNIYRRWEREPCPAAPCGGEGCSRPVALGQGKEPSARPGGRRAFGGKRASSPILGRRGGRTDKICTGAGERPWSTALCEGWGRPRRFLGTGNGRSARLGVGGWRFEMRGSSPPDFGAGSDRSSRSLQALGERGLVPLPSAGEEAAPTAFGAEGRGVYALWGGRGALRQRVPPG